MLSAPATRRRCFVIMPFSREFEDVWEIAIAPAVGTAGFECTRGDVPTGPGAIMKDVVAGIFDADIVVADLSTLNPNVLYELGIAHTIGDKTLMICDRKEARLPFDLAEYRTLFYERTESGLGQLRRELTARLRDVSAWSANPTNPVRQFGPPQFRVPYSSRERQDAVAELLHLDGRTVFSISAEVRGGKHFFRDADATLAAAIGAHAPGYEHGIGRFDLGDPQAHLVVLGSPRYNEAAAQVQEYFDLPCEYVWARADENLSARALRIVTRHGDELSASADNSIDDGGGGTDYGMMVIAHLTRGKRLLWMSGIHGRGTLGVYKALIENAHRLVPDVRKFGSQEDVALSCLVRIRYDSSASDSRLEGIETEILGRNELCARKTRSAGPRALLVDLGGVLMEFDRTRTYRAISHRLGRDYRDIQKTVEGTDLRSRYEQGRLSDDQFCKELASLFGAGGESLLTLLPEFWGDIFWPSYEMFEALRCLKSQGVVLILLSNTNGLHFAQVAQDYPEVLRLFDHRVLSYEIGKEKPDPAIFDAAADWAARQRGIRRADILYADDIREYVQAARSVGIRGFVYRSYPHFIFWLRKQGLYVP